ncbi:hypothetical protein [Roseomonas indoligenes]|uniref:Uncharacterized protein n=1 Tax=Roseomonas indoligenes TaxID=2820811 RepID=A0A940MTB5_9PROT|nr:hypothetical protein [Pararoseomonas indoligenes]MBP0493039.1 hypothetical protein [Pararoseomonas indoligenes]
MPALDAVILTPPPAVTRFEASRAGNSRMQVDVLGALENLDRIRKYVQGQRLALKPFVETPRDYILDGQNDGIENSAEDLILLDQTISAMLEAEEKVARELKYLRFHLPRWPKGTNPAFLGAGREAHNLLVGWAEDLRDARWNVMALRAELRPGTDVSGEGSVSDLRRAVNAMRA